MEGEISIVRSLQDALESPNTSPEHRGKAIEVLSLIERAGARFKIIPGGKVRLSQDLMGKQLCWVIGCMRTSFEAAGYVQVEGLPTNNELSVRAADLMLSGHDGKMMLYMTTAEYLEYIWNIIGGLDGDDRKTEKG